MISSRESMMAKRLRLAGILLIIGLLVEVFSLLWNHPLFVHRFCQRRPVLFV